MADKKNTRVIDFGAALPLGRYPLHRAGLLGADLIERNSEKRTLVEECYRYRRACVRIERMRRKRLRRNMNKTVPKMVELQDEIDRIKVPLAEQYRLLHDERQRLRSRVKLPVVNARIAELKSELAPVINEAKELNERYSAYDHVQVLEAELSPMNKKRVKNREAKEKRLVKMHKIVDSYSKRELAMAKKLSRLNEVARQRTRTRYKKLRDNPAVSLHWGTKNAIAAGITNNRDGRPPKNRRGEGEVTFTVQVTTRAVKGKKKHGTWPMLLAGRYTSDVMIRPIPREECVKLGRPCKDGTRPEVGGGAWSANQYMLKMRVGRDSKTGWVEVPFQFEPDKLPDDAKITSVRLRRRKLRSRYQWRVQFEANSPKFAKKTGDKSVAVDLGWRLRKDGLRVGYYVGSDGAHGEILLPARQTLKRWSKAESLQSTYDLEFNEALEAVLAWKEVNRKRLPTWFKEESRYLKPRKEKEDEPPKKPSPRKLVRLIYRWRENRFAGDEEMFTQMNAWLTGKHHHLGSWQKDLTGRAANYRDEFYRTFAADLRKTYGLVYLADINYQELQKRASSEEKGDSDLVSYLSRKAAVGKLKAALMQCGMEVVLRDPAYLTQYHAECGYTNNFCAPPNVEVTCEGCGKKFDRAYNNAYNLLTGATPLGGKPRKAS